MVHLTEEGASCTHRSVFKGVVFLPQIRSQFVKKLFSEMDMNDLYSDYLNCWISKREKLCSSKCSRSIQIRMMFLSIGGTPRGTFLAEKPELSDLYSQEIFAFISLLTVWKYEQFKVLFNFFFIL